MARRRSPATGEGDDRCPTLKLGFEKGPLEGLITEYKPGTRVRIGRIARGNTLAVKDAGVSSKHLLIQVESLADGGNLGWTLTDLGSSNGTILNGEQLEESKPAVLSDGDVVKIGELTSIKVKLEAYDEQINASSANGRRNTRRGAVSELRIIDENSESGLGLGDKCAGNVNDLVTKSENLGSGSENLGPAVVVRGTRARRSKAAGEMEKVSSMRSGSSQKAQKMQNLVAKLDEDGDKSEEMSEVEGKQEKEVSQIATTGNSKGKLSTLKNSDADKEDYLGLHKGEDGRRVSSRRARSSTKQESRGEAGVDLSIIEGKVSRKKETRGRKKKVLPEISEEKEKNTICEEDGGEPKDGAAEELGESVNFGREGVTELGGTSGVKEDASNIQNAKVAVDLDKMTMGEWLHFLEDFLPKQIVDQTEEMVSEMRQKVERLHEYMLHHKKG